MEGCPCHRGLLEVWKRLLEKTEEVARARINVSEMLMSKVSEEMRQQKRLKEQAFKKVSRQGGREGGRNRGISYVMADTYAYTLCHLMERLPFYLLERLERPLHH